jgi:cytochrome c oxidase assembly protein subunit 15
MRAFARFAWAALFWNLAVVAWGAFVRATGSGAGCGQHWPMCNGEVVPRAPALATAIEFTHRVMSGIGLVLVAALLVWAIRILPRGHAARRAAIAAGLLMVTEALVGAALVLFGWVAKDASLARGWVVALHLANTFLLLAALALVAAVAERPQGLTLDGRGSLAAAILLGLVSTLIAGATGAIAALGDTLYPATSFAEGLRQEAAANASALLRLRVVHPFAAVGGAIAVAASARAAFRACPSDERVRRLAVALLLLEGLELGLGAFNLVLLAPVWLQLAHLLVADLIWLSLVLLAAAALSAGPAPARAAPLAPAPLRT